MRINLVHAIPSVSSAYGQDFDGFSAAIEALSAQHDVEWLNVHPHNPDWKVNLTKVTDADFVLVRSDWGWYPDALAASRLARSGVPCGLVIAGSSRPQSLRQSLRYDVLFYETPWYEQFVHQHPFAVEAFGIDTRVMHATDTKRDIDWLFVGRLASFKRPERLLAKSGRRVIIGDLSSATEATKRRYLAHGIKLVDHVLPEELAAFYNRSHNVLVPCVLQGGGERAVLEGRACGCQVEIAADNPKLETLLRAPIPSHDKYAADLLAGISEVTRGRRTTHRHKLVGEAERSTAVLVDKVRRAPQTVQIRWQNRRRLNG